ncbi:HNH endonuclease [Gordonia phage ChisanaKitsune]|uniref:HNH endonuclease n=1 Tax=Gordonia phage ChisanaKitsune TaxID=2871538 RepID=A0AAE8BX74_9CAUD|nr:HNH endonuclease [Gordonia phage ChisanaKitsune]QZE10794.1 HNH endonuclease [Gordonia phage ChisanaKitsune]
METSDLTIAEIKAGVRRVRDPEFWGAPYGTPITPGLREAHRRGGASAVKKHLKGKKKPAKKTPSSSSGTRTTTPRVKGPAVLDRATGLLRAWGSADDAPDVVRKNVKSKYKVEYVKKAELDKARALAIARSKKNYRPTKQDIQFTKYIIKNGGPGSKRSDREKNMDKLRGDFTMRSARSWAVYNAFGGISPNGKDKGYVPCLGCGIKMTWHNDPKFTNYPKFEHDKIITTGDGGLYHSQNVIPMCAGCNNQRGNKKLWESQAFKGAKPSWYEEHAELVARTRPSATVKQKRPKNEVFPNVMPIPPGKARAERKSQFDIIRRTEDIWKVTDKVVVDESPSNGDRVSANLWNFDGRHNDIEAGVFPPDVDDPTRTVVGRLVMEVVDSPFGSYERSLVVEDDGLISFVEPETVQQVAPAPDFDDAETFNDETTNGTGGGGGGRGRLDTRASRRSRNAVSAGTKALALLGALETKGRIRRVRTAAGVAKYGLPIGSIITRDIIELNFAASGKKKRRAVFKNYPDDIRTTDDIAKPRKTELDAFWKRATNSREWLRDGFVDNAFSNPSNPAKLNGTAIRFAAVRRNDGTYRVHLTPEGPVGVEEIFYAADVDEALDYMAALVQRRYARRNKMSDKPDPDGKWHVNRRERDLDETLWGYYSGLRGVDWANEDDDVSDDEDSRLALVDKEAAELGYKWGRSQSRQGDVGIWAKEMMNSVMRSHEELYPGFAQLHDEIIAHDEAVAWNGRNVNPWSGKQRITLAMNPKYFGENPSDLNVDSMIWISKRTEERSEFNGVDMQKLQEDTGLDKYNAMVLNVMTHELGHTVGNILQSRLYQDGYVPRGQGHVAQEEHTTWAAYEFRERMLDMLLEYGAIDEDAVDNMSFDEMNQLLDSRLMPSTFDRQFFQDHVSGYSSTNFSEVMAEVWAAYQLDPNPSDFVMDMGSLMEEALQTYLADESGPRQKSAFADYTNMERDY